MMTHIAELANLWLRFRTNSAFCRIPNERLPAGVDPDHYGEELMDAWDQIDSLPDDAGPTATLLKIAAAMRGGYVAHGWNGVAFMRGWALAEILIADAFGTDTEAMDEEMRRSAFANIGDVLRAAVEDYPGEGNDGRMFEAALEIWQHDFGADERAAAE